MMNKLILKALVLLVLIGMEPLKTFAQTIQTPFEKTNGNQTPTYNEIIDFYTLLDNKFDKAKLISLGPTDAGKNLQLFIINSDGVFDEEAIKSSNKIVVLINNGIHPGEPEGIDASMNIARDMLYTDAYKEVLQNVIVAIVPVFNIGGALNRGSFSRANQNGPEQYGFRGNAKNLDLNRDFIKQDALETRSLTKAFVSYNVDVFVDNHTSNGADYEHVITLISSQYDKANYVIGDFMKQQFDPLLYQGMQGKGYPMCPYVDPYKSIPDSGIMGFYDSPRYSTGYTSLLNIMGYVVETHMLKPYADRVSATQVFLDCLLRLCSSKKYVIKENKKMAFNADMQTNEHAINWQFEPIITDSILFNGFEAMKKLSKVTGLQVNYYDRNKPFAKKVPVYNKYNATQKIETPNYYIIPQAWIDVVARLENAGVEIRQLMADTSLRVNAYYIEKTQTGNNAYEGHYLHKNTKISSIEQEIAFFKGDFVIPCNQNKSKFIAQTLEPQAVDSYFNWNFFDPILMQKEYFSDYVFDDIAHDIVKENPDLLAQLKAEIEHDPSLAGNNWMQLYFIYKRSKYYESSHNRYPVFRFMGNLSLFLD